MNEEIAALKRKGVQPSSQRVRILEFLRTCRARDFFAEIPKVFESKVSDGKNLQYHPSAEQIHSALVKELPTLSKTTVYNTLKLFEEHALISSILGDKNYGTLRYDRQVEPHAHLLCTQCGEILDSPVSEDVATQLSEVLQANPELSSWQLLWSGTCPSCRP